MTVPNDPDDGDGGVVVPTERRRPGRPLGSKTRPKGGGEPLTRGRLREAVGRTFSPEKLERMLKQLSPVEAARLLASIEPKVREETPGTFQLIVSGLAPICPKCGYRSPMADPGAPVVKTDIGGNGDGR